MKSKIKRPGVKNKQGERSIRYVDRTESEIMCAAATASKTSPGSNSSKDEDESEKNERSGIEAELPAERKQKTLLQDGGIIEIDRKRYKVDTPIIGDYGMVGLMERDNTRALFALHFETQNSGLKRLQVEIDVLKSSTKIRRLNHIIPLLSQGKNSKVKIQYYTTKMYGETIKELRDRLGDFSTCTSLKLSYLSIEAIEEIHRIGFVHRDIKPSVFAIGLEAESTHLFLIAFGLARRYKSANKTAIKKRSKVHRMGNIRYMSRSSHKRLERSRKDDVESWLYMIAEFFLSTLPWDKEKNYDKVLKRKETFLNPANYQKMAKKCKGIPNGTNTIVRQLNAIQYETVPDYHLIKNIFKNAIIQNNYKSEKMDWMIGREGEMLPAGACESKIFGEKSERSERGKVGRKEQVSQREREQASQRLRSETEEEYAMGGGGGPRSVFMMPDLKAKKKRPDIEEESSHEQKSCYFTPSIKANESAYLAPKVSKKKKKKR